MVVMGTEIVQVRRFNKKTIGYILVICAAAFAALLQVVGKPLIESGNALTEINPIMLAAIVFIINGLFFTPLSRKKDPIKTIGRKNLFLMSLIGITEVLAMIFFFYGLKDSTAINASIFSNSEILFSLLIAIIVFRERLKTNELGPFFMIVFGMMILPILAEIHTNGFVFSELLIGDLLILTSGLLYAVDINICKYVSDRFNPKRITQITSFVSGFFALGLVFALEIPMTLQLEQMPMISVIAIFGTGLSTLFFFIALKLIGSIRTVIIYSTTSIFGVIFSGLILSEEITFVNMISIVTVMAGIWLLRNKLGEDHEEEQVIQEVIHNGSSNGTTKLVRRKLINKHKHSSAKFYSKKIERQLRHIFLYEGT